MFALFEKRQEARFSMHIKTKVATCQACKPQEEEVGQVAMQKKKRPLGFHVWKKEGGQVCNAQKVESCLICNAQKEAARLAMQK